MRQARIGIAGLLLVCASAVATEKDEAIRVTYELSTKALTTPLAWSIDPEELNPAFARWVLQREVVLTALEARELPRKSKSAERLFGLSWGFLEARSIGYVRKEGPMYFPYERFSCEKTPDTWFATRDGSVQAVHAAQEAWGKILDERRVSLFLQLERLKADTPEDVLKAAQYVIANWRRALDAEWREKAPAKARDSEWAFYRSLAVIQKECEKPARPKPPAPPTWADLLPDPRQPAPLKRVSEDEPIKSEEFTNIEGHMPARLWDGIFSVRASLNLGGETANGRFLLDSFAPRSVIDPSFLRSQGFLPPLFEFPGAPLERAIWSGEGSGKLARLGHVDRIDLSGVKLPIDEFLISQVTFFGEPESVGPCCDGLLGVDFLRRFTLGFSVTDPISIDVYDSTNFTRPTKVEVIEAGTEVKEPYFWLPVRLNESTHQPESQCELNGAPVRAIWDLGSEEGLRVSASFPKQKSGKWELSCGKTIFARGETLVRESGRPRDTVVIGMEQLGRTPYVLDLPNGRIWFPRSVSDKPALVNRSGLRVGFEFREGQRALVVRSIAADSPAASLSKAGLKPGLEIIKLDKRDVAEIDLWDAEKILAGRDGKTVSVTWRTTGKPGENAVKMAPLKLQ